MKRLILILVAVLAAGGILWFSFADRATAMFENEDDLPASMVATAERRDIESRLLLSGEIVPAFNVDIKAEVGGKIQEIAVQTSQTVKRGDLLAVIDDTELLTDKDAALTEIEGARLAVDKNRGNYERAKALYEEKLISKEVYANLEADLRISENSLAKAESRLRTVEDKLDKTRILAPADGTVLNIPVNEGQVVVAAASVNAGTVIMSFADLSRLLINTHVNQIDVSKVQPGQEVLVNMQGDSGKPITAHVEFVAPLATVKNNIKGFEVQAVIEDADSQLRPGMSVSMTVPIGEANDAVSIPIAGVFQQSSEPVVYVRKGNAIEKRKVTIGLSNMTYAEITSGLNEGESILLFEPATESNPS